MKNMANNIMVTFTVNQMLHEALREAADREQVSNSEIIRRALLEYLSDHKAG